MMFRKIAGPFRVDGGSDTEIGYPLTPSGGGRMCKSVQYMIKVIATSSPTNSKLGLKLNHGPDGMVSAPHSSPIASTATGNAPSLLVGDADSSKIIGEYLHVIVTAFGVGGPSSAMIEVYEMRKPF